MLILLVCTVKMYAKPIRGSSSHVTFFKEWFAIATLQEVSVSQRRFELRSPGPYSKAVSTTPLSLSVCIPYTRMFSSLVLSVVKDEGGKVSQQPEE